ncbi:hypothetical protein ACB098_03G155800 [Castanea mollissima]
MASHSKVEIFVACFAVLVMVVAAQGPGGSMPGSVSIRENMDEMVMPPGTPMSAPPSPSPSSSTSNLPYSSMVIGLLAFIATFLS